MTDDKPSPTAPSATSEAPGATAADTAAASNDPQDEASRSSSGPSVPLAASPTPAAAEKEEDTEAVHSDPLPTTMKASVYYEFNGKHQIAEVALPKVGARQVLIRVHASSVNPVDYKIHAGWMALVGIGKPPYIGGMDVSGVVVKAGARVSRCKEGDEVFADGALDAHAYAEFVCLKEDAVSLKPPSLTHQEAASLPLVCLTSYQALVTTASLQQGGKVLILGGSGGTGLVAVQMARHFLNCSHVVVTCSPRNADLLRSLGATQTLDYHTEQWWEVLQGQQFDVIYDTVGGEDVYSHASLVLNPSTGKLVTIAGDAQEPFSVGKLASVASTVVGRKLKSLFGSIGYYFIMTKALGSDLDVIAQMVNDGHLKAVIDREFPLEDVDAAFAYIKEGHTVGKNVIRVLPR